MPSTTMVESIGRTVRATRNRVGLSLDQLASRAHVSKGALVALENGAGNPNLATLVGIADALGVPVSDLLAEPVTNAVRVATEAAIEPLWRGPSGGEARLLLTNGAVAPVELWRWRLEPGERYEDHPHPTGISETVTVLSGVLGLTVDGLDHAIAADSTAAYPGDVPHAYWTSGDGACDFLMTVHLLPNPGAGASRPGRPTSRPAASRRTRDIPRA